MIWILRVWIGLLLCSTSLAQQPAEAECLREIWKIKPDHKIDFKDTLSSQSYSIRWEGGALYRTLAGKKNEGVPRVPPPATSKIWDAASGKYVGIAPDRYKGQAIQAVFDEILAKDPQLIESVESCKKIHRVPLVHKEENTVDK